MPRVIIVNTPGPQGPRGPGGIYEGSGSLTISGSVSATSSFWNIATDEFQIVDDPAKFTNDFFLVKNDYTELKLGTVQSDAGVTITSVSNTPFLISNNVYNIVTVTNSGSVFLATQSALPTNPNPGGILFFDNGFFVSL
jgi:hypothetical protein